MARTMITTATIITVLFSYHFFVLASGWGLGLSGILLGVGTFWPWGLNSRGMLLVFNVIQSATNGSDNNNEENDKNIGVHAHNFACFFFAFGTGSRSA